MDNRETSSAVTRIKSLLDEFSFVEIGRLAEARSTDFNMAEKKAPSDGVVTGYGTIDGSLVYIYAQDSAVLGGSIGEMHARKIANLYSMAMKNQAPVISLIDCSGVRLEEADDALFGLGRIFKKQTLASGQIPEITVVFGNCGGGLTVLAGLSDFVAMEAKDARMYVNAPDAVQGNKDDKIAKAETQAANGLVDFYGTEDEIFAQIRKLVSILPGSNDEGGVQDENTDDLNRSVGAFDTLDAEEAAKQLSDNGVFIETKKGYSKDVLTGLAQIGGETVGLVLNKSANLTWKGAEKAAKLVTFCNAFDLPVVSVVDVKKYNNTECTEKFMPEAAARLAYAYANADVPMITIVKNAYGTAGVAFGSKALGADAVYAYEGSGFGILDAKKAAEILADSDEEKAALEKDFGEKATALAAAKRGYVDDIIAPEETRQRVAAALQMLNWKSVYRPDKKHGTV